MNLNSIENIILCLLFSSGDPLSISQITDITGFDNKEVKNIVKLLKDRFDEEKFAIRIKEVDGKYQLISSPEYEEYVKTLLNKKRNTPLSQASFEVLSIVAYNQPVTRSYIDQIRGVDSSGVLRNLIEKNLIEEDGRLDAPGKPLLFKTTNNFLNVFNISSVTELPNYSNDILIDDLVDNKTSDSD